MVNNQSETNIEDLSKILIETPDTLKNVTFNSSDKNASQSMNFLDKKCMLDISIYLAGSGFVLNTYIVSIKIYI